MNWNGLESPSIESERLVQVSLLCDSSILSRAGHEESCLNPVRLNTPKRPIVDQYCEGKVKRTPNRGVK